MLSEDALKCVFEVCFDFSASTENGRNVKLKIHEATIPFSDGSFALPLLPEETEATYRVLRLHVKTVDCRVWWRPDGEEISEHGGARLIARNATRSFDDPDQIAALRFKFEGAKGSLQVIYEGVEAHAWLKERAPLTPEEFAAPIVNASRGKEQMRTKSCVDAVVATNPGAVIYRDASEFQTPAEAQKVDAPESLNPAKKHNAVIEAVRASMRAAGGR